MTGYTVRAVYQYAGGTMWATVLWYSTQGISCTCTDF